ncbi:uncharacterized protein L203_104498 [Cryptococcus depauperatus CBS 7841]|uniref:C3H1-type domain-containing protein n=1 Tax=Cryptococcus depauperatus CBS 7841 TaxID=1295531 RepID=A0AAJ8JVS2_9TREE
MSSLTEAEKKKLQLQQEIARLSGAISRRAASTTSYKPYKAYSRGRSSGVVRGRGRGRGSYSLDLRSQNRAYPTTPVSSANTINPQHQLLTATINEQGELEDVGSSSAQPNLLRWAKNQRTGNKSLMTVEKWTELSNAQSGSSTVHFAKRPIKPKRPKLAVKAFPSLVPGGTPRVTINGVFFEFMPGGKGLKRSEDLPSPNPLEWYIDNRKVVKVLDINYKFQLNGELLPLKTATNRLCPSYTKTGRCHKAHICKYIHDPTRVAICSKFLQGRCELDSLCPLSHSPSAHNTPSCARFQLYTNCTFPGCPYPHVKVSSDAPICEDFAFIGWCDREEGSCTGLHSWDCPEFWSTGKCPRKDRCRFRHTLRAEKGRVLIQPKEESNDKKGKILTAPRGFEEQNEFIEFDQGSPGLLLSDEDEDNSAESNESEDEEESDEEYGENGQRGNQEL